MGPYLSKPITEKHSESGQGQGLRYGLSCMQGWRTEMEDAHCIRSELPGLPDWSFFAIFDGHAGSTVAIRSSQELITSILTNEDFSKTVTAGAEPSVESVTKGIKTGFLQLDNSLRNTGEGSKNFPHDLAECQEDRSGSTAICVMVSPTRLYFANCGDSRAVLSRAGSAAFGTHDHKPGNPREKERIEQAGGCVMLQRVNGSLAVSRALGDFDFKSTAGKSPCEQMVSPEPDVTVEERTGEDEFIILACDGIWDVMSNDDLCDFVRQRLTVTDDLTQICNQVIDVCLHKGSRDNMSVLIITLPGAPKLSEEALLTQQKLYSHLETKIKELLRFQSVDGSEVEMVMCMLASQDIEGLPPNCSIHALRSTVEEIVSRLSTPSLNICWPTPSPATSTP